MPHLRFLLAELVKEVSTLQIIARDYLDGSTTWTLDNFKGQIEHIWEALPDGAKTNLVLQPLATVVSPGHYEPIGRTGGVHIYARISGTWDVQPIGQKSKKEKVYQNRSLQFCGIASTRIELYEKGDNENSIAMWKMELGDSTSPGCYFHVQVLGDGEAPFPKAVSVPRLPSIFITPMSIIEFVIGELFQNRWGRAVSEENANILYWRTLQKERLIRLLNWQSASLENVINTPWMTLKTAKPPEDLFLIK